jgi:hypothetical protein
VCSKDVILRMFYEHLCPDPHWRRRPETLGLPLAIICDLDGTLALMKGRGPFEWDKVGQDGLNASVADILRQYNHGPTKILIVSGRDGCCEAASREWVSQCGIDFDGFWMRPAGNTEPDSIIKRRIYDEHIRGKFDVLAVFDDRPCVVRLWRSLGLFVFDCGNGVEF